MATPAPTPAPKKPATVKLTAKYPPFIILPTGQEVGEAPVEFHLPLDGWVQANIDNGLLVVEPSAPPKAP